MAEPIEFFVEPIKNVEQQAYLDYRDRLASMKQKDISNPKKMAGMKKAVMGKFDLEADEMEDILDEYNPKKIDPTDPKTWMKFDDGRVDIGRSLLVEDSVALTEETGIYRKQAQALGDETLGVIESQVSTYSTRVLGQAGIDPSKTAVNNPVYRDNYKRTMSSIYQDVIDGIDPMDAFDSHLDKLGLPREFEDHLFKQTESITEMMRSGADVAETVPYPKVTQDVIDSFTDKPVYFPADDIPTPASVEPEPTSRLRGTLAEKIPTPPPASVEPEPTSRLRGTLAEKIPTPPPVSAPSVATAPPVVAKASTTDLSPAQMSFIETIKAEKAATEEAARNAIPATRQSIEESGYLYHYAPREARDSILSGGFDVSKARTAVGDIAGQHAEFATHVPDNSMYFYTRPEDAPSAGTIFGTGETGQRPDLYRTKIEPGMLDDMVVDPRLPLRDGVGSAVIVPSKTGKFQAELIGQNAEFGIRGDNISPATYDPISTVAPPEIKTIGAENLTEAGKARANAVGRADKVLSAMDDDELIEYLKNSQDFLAKQQKIDPDGKIFKPQAEYRLKSVEKELRDRGIHPDDAAPSVAKTSATKKGPIDIGKPVDDIRTSPTARGTDAASGGSVTPSGTPHNVATTQNLTTKNTNPTTTQPKAQAKINSQTTASGTNIATNRPAGPGNTQKAKGLLDNGLKTAQDLAGGNARLMGIAGIAGLLGVGVASSRSRTKQNPPPDRGTYMDRSRQDLDY